MRWQWYLRFAKDHHNGDGFLWADNDDCDLLRQAAERLGMPAAEVELRPVIRLNVREMALAEGKGTLALEKPVAGGKAK